VVLGYSFFAHWVFRGKTPEKGLGRMSTQSKQLLWFAGIYVSSLIVFAFVTYLLKAVLRLL
jgi:hypothetical protein